MSEQWKPIVGWEGLYEVSDLGRVRSLDRVWVQPAPRSGAPHEYRYRGRVLTGGRDAYGYVVVHLRRPPQTARSWCHKVHQLVLAAFVGPRPADRPQTRHLNGNQIDNRLTNLQYGTALENAADRVRHGRGKITLPVADLLTAASHESLARRFGVSKSTVIRCRHELGWRRTNQYDQPRIAA